MGLESVTNIADLVAANPVGATDPKSEGDDHIRNIKTALLTDLPNITGPITATQAELNHSVGLTSAAVGLTDTQTLTNKTLASPTINSPTVSVLTLSDGSIVAEGATANDFESTLTFTDPTADRTVTIQDATTTLIGRDTTDTLINKSIDSDNNTVTNLDASTIDFTLATGGSWSISSTGNQVIPAGFYMAARESGTATLTLEINQASTWRASTSLWTEGLLLSDGTNIRLTGSGSGSAIVYYRQLA